jgi:hypothetical protein
MPHDDRDMESRFAPTGPLLGPLALLFAWIIELLALGARLLNGGKWPASHKFWVVTAITIVATVYKLTYWRQHKAYALPSSPIATNSQSWLIVGLVAFYLAIGAWLFIP